MFLLYIDPGTGSMLFAALLGLVSTGYFFLQQLRLKIKYRGGKIKKDDHEKELVIFGEGGQYWKVFRPVCDELERREIDCEYYTMDEKDPALQSDYKHIKVVFIGTGNKAFAKLNIMQAYICLATTPGLDVYQWRRSKGVKKYVHLLHAVDDGTGYRMFGMDEYDTILMTGQFQEKVIRKLEQLREEPEKELVVAGCTYLDVLMERRQNSEEIHKSKKTVLLAPSWGSSAIFAKYGEEIIEALLKTGYTIIIRPHPQTLLSEKNVIEPILEKYSSDERLEWDMEHDNFNSLNRADVLITDFSGMIYEYAFVFGKPVIYADTELDLAPYDAAWIDEPLWRLEILPEVGIQLKHEDFDRIKDVIDEIAGSTKYASNIKRLSDMAWQEKGKAAVNVADYLQKLIEINKTEEETIEEEKAC